MYKKIITTAERWLQTDLSYVGKNIFWIVVGQIMSIAFGLVVSVSLANIFSQHEYGVYKFIISTSSILLAFQLTGLKPALVQAVARGFDGVVLSSMKLHFKWSVPIFISAILVSLYYFFNNNITLSLGILLVTVISGISATVGIYNTYLSGKEKFKTVTIHALIITFVNAIVIEITLLYTKSVLATVLMSALSIFISTTTLAYKTLKSAKLKKTTAINERQALKLGKHISLQNILIVIANHLDKIIIFQWIGGIELAKYALSMMLSDQIRGTAKKILSLAVPRYANKNKNELRFSIKKKSWQLTLLMIIPVGLYILIAPALFSLLFPSYVNSVIYSQLLTLGIITMPATYLINTFFTLQEKTKILYYCSLIPSVIRLALMIILIWNYGVWGAIIAYLIARFVTLATHIYFYSKNDNN